MYLKSYFLLINVTEGSTYLAFSLFKYTIFGLFSS